MRIENLSLVTIKPEPYLPPEMQQQQLHGKVYGSEKFEDGEVITTSDIISIGEGKARTLSGSEYELGSIDPDYLKAYPKATRLLEI